MAVSSKKARKTYLCMVQSIQIFRLPLKAVRVDNPVISFTENDARQLHHPHEDTLVISLSIADFDTRQVLVENESLADILYYPAFLQIRIDKECLLSSDASLVGFGGIKVFPVGTIILLVTIGTYPQQLTREVSFHVVDCSSAYNAIIDRPTLNAWRAAMSTYQLLVKFPTEYAIKEAREDQMAAYECYVSMLEMDDHL